MIVGTTCWVPVRFVVGSCRIAVLVLAVAASFCLFPGLLVASEDDPRRKVKCC